MGRKAALFRGTSQDCPKNATISRSSLPPCEEKQQSVVLIRPVRNPLPCSPPFLGRLFSSLTVISTWSYFKRDHFQNIYRATFCTCQCFLYICPKWIPKGRKALLDMTKWHFAEIWKVSCKVWNLEQLAWPPLILRSLSPPLLLRPTLIPLLESGCFFLWPFLLTPMLPLVWEKFVVKNSLVGATGWVRQ